VTRPKYPHSEALFHLCLVAALAFVAAIFCSSCAHPLPDLGKIPRGQYSRTVTDIHNVTCQDWLPLVARVELGQEALTEVLRAAQPWADELGFALVVPAKDGEEATLTVSVEACPDEWRKPAAPFCGRLAQEYKVCEGGVARHRIELFIVGDAVQDFYTLMHELGHALGADGTGDKFGHSADRSSIMYPEISAENSLMGGDAGADAKMSIGPVQWVRFDDVAAVRRSWRLK
jgi:hypothetical protein